MTWPRLHPRTSASSPVRRRSKRGEGEQLRQEVIDAAERLLIETGDERSVSIRAIAGAVGVSPPAVYLHFPDKDALIYAVCAQQFAKFDAALEAAAAGATDPVDELRRRAHAYVDFGLTHREPYRIMFMTHPAAAMQDTDVLERPGMQAFQHLVGAVQRGIDAQVFRPVDAVSAAIGVWTGMHGITSLLISLNTFPWPDLDALVEIACRPHLNELLVDRPPG